MRRDAWDLDFVRGVYWLMLMLGALLIVGVGSEVTWLWIGVSGLIGCGSSVDSGNCLVHRVRVE